MPQRSMRVRPGLKFPTNPAPPQPFLKIVARVPPAVRVLQPRWQRRPARAPTDGNGDCNFRREEAAMSQPDAAGCDASTVSDEPRAERVRGSAQQEGPAQQAGQAAGERARSFFSAQMDTAHESLQALADALHESARSLERREQTRVVAHQVDRAAGGLEEFARSIRGADLETSLRRAGGFAREHPGVLVAGAAALGMMAGRFLRASRLRREREESWEPARPHAAASGERMPEQGPRGPAPGHEQSMSEITSAGACAEDGAGDPRRNG
jgi:hypothetical protein